MLRALPLSVVALSFALCGLAQDTVTDTATITETTTITTTESASASATGSQTSISTTTLTTARSTATSPVQDGAQSYSSDEPLVCAEGCWLSLGYWHDCYSENTTAVCGPVCTGDNYTALVTCFECGIANGAGEQEPEFPLETLELGLVNQVCGALGVSGFAASTTLTATPTTTGPFSTSGTGNVTLPTWTGFTSYIDAYTSSLAAAAAATSTTSSSSSSSAASNTTSTSSAGSSASASASSGAASRHEVSARPMGAALMLLLALVMV